MSARPGDDTCRSCNAPIIWATTDRGVSMPVDRDPVAGGNVQLTPHESRPGQHRAKVVTPRLTFGRTDLRMPHHASCPQGRAWKRKRGAR